MFSFAVTVARAVELKHNASLISALANETSKLFLDAANTLRPFKPEISGQWIKYLELKSMFYQSYVSTKTFSLGYLYIQLTELLFSVILLLGLQLLWRKFISNGQMWGGNKSFERKRSVPDQGENSLSRVRQNSRAGAACQARSAHCVQTAGSYRQTYARQMRA